MDLEKASHTLVIALKSSGALLMERWGRTTGARLKESIHSVVTDAGLTVSLSE